MRSPFAEAAAAASAAVDDVYGERLRLVPQGKAGRGGGTAGADKTRQPVDFTGAVTRRSVLIQRQGIGAQGATNIQLSDAKWTVSLDAVLAAALGALPGDLVERLDPTPGEPSIVRISAPAPIRGRMIHPADEI